MSAAEERVRKYGRNWAVAPGSLPVLPVIYISRNGGQISQMGGQVGITDGGRAYMLSYGMNLRPIDTFCGGFQLSAINVQCRLAVSPYSSPEVSEQATREFANTVHVEDFFSWDEYGPRLDALDLPLDLMIGPAGTNGRFGKLALLSLGVGLGLVAHTWRRHHITYWDKREGSTRLGIAGIMGMLGAGSGVRILHGNLDSMIYDGDRVRNGEIAAPDAHPAFLSTSFRFSRHVAGTYLYNRNSGNYVACSQLYLTGASSPVPPVLINTACLPPELGVRMFRNTLVTSPLPDVYWPM